MSGNWAQLWIDSYSAQQAADSTNPRYCRLEKDIYSVAPYPDADFSRAYTYVHYMLDIPPDEAEKIARIYFDSHERQLSWEEYRDIFVQFSKRGGKYIRTLIVMGPGNVGWDSDGEEDFWALPVPCDGWEKVEKNLKKLQEKKKKP